MKSFWKYFNLTGGPFERPSPPDWRIELSVLGGKTYYKVVAEAEAEVPTLHDTTAMSAAVPNATLLPEYLSGNYSAGMVDTLNDSGNVTGFDTSLGFEHFVLILMYSATTILAIVGNSVAIVIFAKGKRSKTDLRPFLINLAVADLIMAIFCIPFTFTYQLLRDWIFSAPMCPIVMFLQTVSVTGSVSTNMAIGIDRFCAIAFPLKGRITASKYKMIIVVIWVISTGLTVVLLFVGQTEKNPVTNLTECNEKWPDPAWNLYWTILLLLLTYIIPVIILTITYSIVGYLLWKRNLPGNADAHRDQAQLRAKLKIVKMLVTVVVLFALCWLPLHTFFFILTSLKKDEYQNLDMVYFICHWLAMSNSFVNPIIYGFLNDSFRADLKMLMFKFIPFTGSNRNTRHGAVKFKRRSDRSDLRQQNSNSSADFPSRTFLGTKFHSEWGRNGSSIRTAKTDSTRSLPGMRC